MPAPPANSDSALEKDLEVTLEIFRQKQAMNPNDPSAYNALGVMMGARGEFPKALEAFERALQLCPTYAEALVNKGLVLEILGRDGEALPCFAAAGELTPFYTEAESKAAAISRRLGQPRPKSPWQAGWRARLSGMFRRSQQEAIEGELTKKSETEIRARIRLRRDDSAAALALGHLCKAQSRAIEAEHFFRYALRLEPKNQGVAVLLANVLQEQERASAAIELLSRFQDAPIKDDRLLPLLLTLKARACDWRGYEKLFAAATAVVKRSPETIEPFVVLGLWDEPALQFQCLKAYAAVRTGGITPMTLPDRSRQRQRLTVGYVSADFRQHAVATLLAQLFELHDRKRFRVIGYSLWADDGSAIRRRIDAGVDKMVSVWGLSAIQAAQKIAADNVDILVDLTAFTAHGRPQIFAYRPAPVQVNLIGLGASFMDYVIADAVALPERLEQFYAEKIVRLPITHQMNDRKRVRPAPLSRTHHGLPADGLVFCSFSTSIKITPRLFDIWMKILDGVPGSVLWLRGRSKDIEDNLRAESAARGVNPDRLFFAAHCGYEEHLSRYGVADLALDTFGFGGHTTASDALWMGCPIVTCIGNTFFGRVGASLLGAIGVPELITNTAEEYEALIVKLATMPGALTSLRRRIEHLRDGSRLFDSERKTREIEWAYEHMWSLYAEGRPPQTFDVPELEMQSNKPER